MIKKTIKLLLVIIAVFGISQSIAFPEDKELIILQDKVKLMIEPNNLKSIKELRKLEKVNIVKPDLVKDYIQVKTEDGETGWVLEKYTSFITDDWRECNASLRPGIIQAKIK